MNHLYRSRENRLLGGVAGGIAEYFAIDIAVVRLLWVLSIFFAGGGILAYIIAWIVIPERTPENDNARTYETTEAPGQDYQAPEPERRVPARAELTPEEEQARARRRSAGGLILIGLGVLFLLYQLAPWHFSRFFWPLLLIAAGVFIFVRGREGGK